MKAKLSFQKSAHFLHLIWRGSVGYHLFSHFLTNAYIRFIFQALHKHCLLILTTNQYSCVSHSVVSGSLWPHGPQPCQVSLSMEFSRQEYWSGLPFPSPGDLPNPGIEPESLALQTNSLPEPPGKPIVGWNRTLNVSNWLWTVYWTSSSVSSSVKWGFKKVITSLSHS